MILRKHKLANWAVFAFLLISLAAIVPYAERVEAESESASGSKTGHGPAAREKYALLVGVSKYNRGSTESGKDWWDLNTVGDVEIIAETLVRKFKFKPENIRILADKEITFDGNKIAPTVPTGEAIKNAFKESLIDKVKQGDVVYFHFSGHGQQVPDKNGDEIDGMDESLVPADYVSQKDGSKNLIDDEISVLLEALSEKKPSNVTITLDSCFSGTGTRGEGLARGGEWKGEPIDKKFAGKTDDSAADFVSRGGGERGGGSSEQKYVFISAASQRQTAKEMKDSDGRSFGVFSYSLVKAFDQAGENTTYRDLYARLSDIVTTKQEGQNPQIEGSEIDNLLMEDGALPPEKHVGVKIGLTGKPYLTAGKLQGMTTGSKFALYPAEAKGHTPGSEIANATVTVVNPLTSSIELDETLSKDALKTIGRAFETEHSYEDVMKVWIQDGLGIEGLGDSLTKMGLVGKSRNPEVWDVRLYIPDASDKKYAGKLVLDRQGGEVIKVFSKDEKTAKAVEAALQGEAKRVLLKSLDQQDPSLANVELKLIPVKANVDENTGSITSVTDRGTTYEKRNGKIEMEACTINEDYKQCIPGTGETFQLEITNNNRRAVYVTVLNLNSEGKVAAMFPYIGNQAGSTVENRIKAGETYRVPLLYTIEPPFGEESFRAFVTEYPTDFTPLVDPTTKRGEMDERGKNAENSPLGQLLKSGVTGQRSQVGGAPATWATKVVTFYVVPPKE